MATATEIQSPSHATEADAPYDLTVDLFSRMVESGLILRDRRRQ